MKLAKLGDELAFHIATDPAAYADLHATLAGRRGATARAVKPRHVFRRASPTLKRAIAV